ncbi:MAG TPA: histidinol dehydrogenase [Thermoanaerobaculia bacterium]|nr:histidinol dehydrogenase [Thermoanaerobaculia bacterium]
MTLRMVKVDSRRGLKEIDRLRARGRATIDRKTMRRARSIVDEVRRRGDRALLAHVAELDGVAFDRASSLRQPLASADELRHRLPTAFEDALERAIAAIDAFHAPQVRPGYEYEHSGVWLEERRHPLRRVGVYIPGGRFPYPSTVLMTVIPARLAGVEEIVVATPPKAFATSLPLRFALQRLDVREIWGMGGAHAIAALAYGTETVRRVDKIVGPGNAWVNAAKRIVAGDVGIDGLPGPTEIVVFADASTDPALVAADLLAQAEHDAQAAAILITDDRRFAKTVAEEIDQQLASLSTASTARESIRRYGVALLVDELEHGLDLVEAIAPEHLQLMGAGPEALLHRVSRAGAVVVGRSSTAVFGDYVAGPSHVLPTGGSARWASALGVEDFIRRSHSIRFTPEAAQSWAETAATLADVEGLAAHAAAARRRLRR